MRIFYMETYGREFAQVRTQTHWSLEEFTKNLADGAWTDEVVPTWLHFTGRNGRPHSVSLPPLLDVSKGDTVKATERRYVTFCKVVAWCWGRCADVDGPDSLNYQGWLDEETEELED